VSIHAKASAAKRLRSNGLRVWSYEDTVTKFATIEEARPVLKESEADQAAARAILGKY
jgi:hypothetical protein